MTKTLIQELSMSVGTVPESVRFRLLTNQIMLNVELRPEPFYSDAIISGLPDIYRAEAMFKDMMVEEVSRTFARLRRGLSTPKSCQTCHHYRQHRTMPHCGLCVAGRLGSCVEFSLWEAMKDE